MQQGGPLILATSDIHSPHYLPVLASALRAARREYGSPCLILLAGDIVDKGVVVQARPVFDLLWETYPGVPIVAVFGNEEYHELQEKFRKEYSDVTWLDDETAFFDCNNETVSIVGTRGSLARPTRWQRRNMPWIEKVYRKRPTIIRGLLREARREADRVILLSHYALSEKTVKGEPPALWPYLYDPAMERVVAEEKPDAAVHGHAHRGTPFALVNGVPVHNVALPLNRKIVKIKMIIKLI